MTVLVALPAELARTTADFVRDWNSDPECIKVAVAAAPAADQPNYSADLVNTVLIAFTGATAKTTFDYIFQRLQERYFRHKADETITIKTRHLDDGTEVTEVVIDK
jgi:hypothetical protein